MLINRQRLQAGGAIKEGFVEEELIALNQQFSVDSPSFMDSHIHKDIVEDEVKVAWFNTGYPSPRPFYSIDFGGIESSGWTKYGPAEVRYRFLGF